MSKFENADNLGRKMVDREAPKLPNVDGTWWDEAKAVIDGAIYSARTWVPTEVKYRRGHNYKDHNGVTQIQRRKYDAIMEEGGGFLWVFYEDSWWLFNLFTTKPCKCGEWTHKKYTVESSATITDDFVGFCFEDAFYHRIKE